MLSWYVRSSALEQEVDDSSLRHYLCYNCAANDLVDLLESGPADGLPPAKSEEIDILYQTFGGTWLVDYGKLEAYLKQFVIPYSKQGQIYGGTRRPENSVF